MATVATIYRSPRSFERNIPPSFGKGQLIDPTTFRKRGLAEPRFSAEIAISMWTKEQWRQFGNKPVVQTTLFVVGVVLILLSPIIGALPGPGGIFVFAAGLAMVLRTSRWARRRYVHFKRWQPKAGRFTDWGLRRRSHIRREAIRKEREQAETGQEISERR